MGSTPGVAEGYATGPAATVGDVPTTAKKRTNHMFVGPDYPVVHPGIFPHNPDAKELATLEEWTQFDHEAGWGTPDFESAKPDAQDFPDVWGDVRKRLRARKILDSQEQKLAE